MLSQSSRANARLSSPSSSRLAVGQIHQRVSHKYRVNRPAIALNSNSIVRAPPAKADTIRQKQGVGHQSQASKEKLFDGFIVTEEFAKRGMRVERGMDWKWGDQVGG